MTGLPQQKVELLAEIDLWAIDQHDFDVCMTELRDWADDSRRQLTKLRESFITYQRAPSKNNAMDLAKEFTAYIFYQQCHTVEDRL